MTNRANLSITLTADAIAEAATAFANQLEEALDDIASELATNAWADCGLPDIECIEDGPLVVACMELMVDARNAILAAAIERVRAFTTEDAAYVSGRT